MSNHQARQDLTDKLKFEKIILKKLNSLNRGMARDQIVAFEANQTLNAERYRKDVEKILNEHYEIVGNEFSNRMIPDLPEDIPISQDELGVIASALAIFYLARSGEQSSIISISNQVDIDDAIKQTSLIADEQSLAGKPMSKREQATTSGAILNRKLKGRAPGIASYETQVAAETAKATETDVLIGQDPSVLAGTNKEVGVNKEWTSVGDNLVRDPHRLADGQVVMYNEPYTVGGEKLNIPGDMSQGASLGNVINCRCASVVAKTEVYAERRNSQELLLSIQDQL